MSGTSVTKRVLASVAVFCALICAREAEAATYTPLKVLFVANGNYSQETYLQNHLTALGATVTKMKDYQVKSTTNIAAYDLLIITEFAPNIPGTALEKNHRLVDSQERQDMLDAISIGIEAEPTYGPPLLGRFARERFRWDNMDVFLRTAPASAPWSWSEPIDTGKPGYVGGIIDAFTSFSYAMTVSQDCVYKLTAANLWFTTSVWHGDVPPHGNGLPGAYGVYTTSTKTPFLWSERMYCGDTDVEP